MIYVSWRSVVFEKLPASQLVSKVPTRYWTRNVITVSVTALGWVCLEPLFIFTLTFHPMQPCVLQVVPFLTDIIWQKFVFISHFPHACYMSCLTGVHDLMMKFNHKFRQHVASANSSHFWSELQITALKTFIAMETWSCIDYIIFFCFYFQEWWV
jgi:hypothetical protein